MSLSEIKKRLVDAHRSGNWEEARKLSQLKQTAKKKHRCVDCGVPLSKNGVFRCAMHFNIHRYYSRALPFIALFLLVVSGAQAGNVVFEWDKSASTNVSGYFLYGSTNLLSNTNFHSSPVAVDCGTNTICSLSSTNLGQWYFAVTAYAWDQTNRMESDLSNILPLRFPPVPTNFVFLIPQYTATIAGTNWQDIGFFRVKIGMP